MPSAVAFGERAFSRGQFNEDMLLAMAEYEMNKPKRDASKVVSYANKVVEVMSAKTKPEGVADADWDKKKNTTLGVAHWMAGETLAGQNNHAQADKSLRASLPYLKGNDQLLARALFHLSMANYKMAQASKNKALAGAGASSQKR
jgi:hypothetical protein